MLCVVELDVPIYVWVGSAVKCANVDEEGWRLERWEELVEEGGGAIEQDSLGSEEEAGVLGSGVLVAIELVLGEDAWGVVVAVDHVGFGLAWEVGERGQLVKVGGIESVIVAEGKVGACERCVSFEFLDSM